jgi:8-amino-7-oxononanoate synthase
VNYSRPFIYSTAPGFHNLAAIKSSYRILGERLASKVCKPETIGSSNKKQTKLQNNIAYLHSRIIGTGLSNSALTKYVAKGPIFSSIFSLLCPYPRELAKLCQASGFMVRPIVSPTVPKGKERIRICVHSENTLAEIDALLTVTAGWVEEFNENNTKLRSRI